MATMWKCLECENKFKDLYEDPRDPPLSALGNPCLCKECLVTATVERIQELQDEIKELVEALV